MRSKVVDWVVVILIVIGVGLYGGMVNRAYSAEPEQVSSMTAPWAPPCIYEDGSSQRKCAWIGTEMANGKGRSFVVNKRGLRRTYTYMSARQAKAYVNEWKRRFCSEPTSANPDDRVCTHWQIVKH